MSTRKTKKSPRKITAFLDALADGLSVREAANCAGVPKRTAYRWRDEDQEFKAAWKEAYQQGADALFVEARRRAVEGVSEPVFYKGEEVGAVQKYSDTLLMFLMKSRDPVAYCDRVRASTIERESRDNGDTPDFGAIATLAGMLADIATAKAAQAHPDED